MAKKAARKTARTTGRKGAAKPHPSNLRVDYVEFPAVDLPAVKRFYATAFGWQFTDWGSDYTSFNDGRLNGGFRKAAKAGIKGGAMVVIYAADLENVKAGVVRAGGRIVGKMHVFPGGRRFYFSDPSGNVLAVWSDK